MKLRNALLWAAILSFIGVTWGYAMDIRFHLILSYNGQTIVDLNHWMFWLAMLPVLTLILWERFRI